MPNFNPAQTFDGPGLQGVNVIRNPIRFSH
jgi:hypothetical protein